MSIASRGRLRLTMSRCGQQRLFWREREMPHSSSGVRDTHTCSISIQLLAAHFSGHAILLCPLKTSGSLGKLQTDAVMLHFLFLSLLLHLLPFSSCSSSENSWCSEGRQRLDSVAFLACQQQGLSKLHKMGIWITRSLDPNWQVGNHQLTTNSTENIYLNRSPLTACQYASTWPC